MNSFIPFFIVIIWCFISIPAQNVTHHVDSLSKELKSLMCDGLSVGGNKCDNKQYGIQDFIYSFQDYFANDVEDSSELAEKIIDRLDKKLNLRASFLKNMSFVIQSSCLINFDNDESITDFDHLMFAGNIDRESNLPSDMKYSKIYENEVSLSSSTYKLPNDVDYNNKNVQRDAQISKFLDEVMIDLYAKYCIDDNGNEEYCNMYFGTINGVFTQYPGAENSKNDQGIYNSYDPRFRPWYVTSASGRKDVIILVDVSGSMKDNNRLTLAKNAVISVLNTLGASSFVSVIAFNGDIKLSCFNEQLVPATRGNVDELVHFVSTLNANSKTNFTIAFDAAFRILENSATSCQTSILFLTDGAAPDVSNLIERRNTEDINAVIFSYTLGDDARSSVPQKVAEMTNGIYTHIDDNDENLITAMSSYYLYFAYGLNKNDDNIIITSPYLDYDTGIIMITMAMSVYYNSTYFVGVVGIDIPLSFLSNAIGDIIIGRKSYSFVVNEESELIIHPLIPDPYILFNNNEYNPIYIDDVEPNELNKTILINRRQKGMINVDATVKQSAGDVAYNGYIYENANLLYIYSGVGPVSLSIIIVIYTEYGLDLGYVPSFGLNESPNIDCNITQLPHECLSPFNLYQELDLMLKCNSSWINDAEIINTSKLIEYEYLNGATISLKYPSYYLQAGLWENSFDAMYNKPSCTQLNELHKLTNRLGGISNNNLPFDGFRSEINSKILNSIYTVTSLHEFWKESFLSNDSSFLFLYFSTYNGIFINYPAIEYPTTFNPLIRPWYQRAISYPDLYVFTTPYHDAATGLLIASGATAIYAPNSIYPFGVASFDYRFNEFISYWQNIMNNICDQTKDQYCYLIDSSAFLLYYDGIQNDINDEDISYKYFGDFEPTLMQSLLEKEFFINETNINFQDNTIDISYITNNDVYYTLKLNEIYTTFNTNYNTGKYTIHIVTGTNLYVIYIKDYHLVQLYPSDCPYNDACSRVEYPGCITYDDSSTECISASIDVCDHQPDAIFNTNNYELCVNRKIDNFGICILQSNDESDICASNFNNNDCLLYPNNTPMFNETRIQSSTKEFGLSQTEKIIIGCVVSGIGVICLLILIWFCNYRDQPEGKENKKKYKNIKQQEPHTVF